MKKHFVSALLCLAVFSILCADAVAEEETSWPLAVRIRSYGDYPETAWTHLPQIGVKYLFLSVPAVDEVDATLAKLKKHNLTPLVMRGDAKLSATTFVADITPQLATCQKMGVKYMFMSAKREDTPLDATYARLRAAGDVAKKYGVIIALETHPDLGTNGAVQCTTMKGINHPNIRVNYDTANITYYNKNTSAVKELKKSIDYVATVEFKDHNCEFETWVFPPLGEGKVKFPKIVKMLKKADYAGPLTLEFEGTKGVKLTEEQTKKAIADSVAYARSIANLD
jgi:sugar phosphate isomerase/epimerase